jgi:integrase/recombinase XerD
MVVRLQRLRARLAVPGKEGGTMTPDITIFVRHSTDCKHSDKGDFFRKCDCRKHLRWTVNGKRYRRPAGTRSWQDAELVKRELDDQLSGKIPATPAPAGRLISDAVTVFMADKAVQGVTPSVMGKYKRELARLASFAEREGVFTVSGLDNREMLTRFCTTWPALYPSSTTRSKVRERLRSFLRYCYEAKFLDRIPQLPKIKVEEPPTLPLTEEEFARLLDAAYAIADTNQAARVAALFKLMRWSGLAIQDALTLERSGLEEQDGTFRVLTARQKTKVHVCVPIPPDVARSLLAVAVSERYFFWSGTGQKESITKNWDKYYIAPAFTAAGITGGYMKAHRLRDTFAVDLLKKGVDIADVAKALGDTVRIVEKHYAAWCRGRQARLDSVITGTWEEPQAKLKVVRRTA